MLEISSDHRKKTMLVNHMNIFKTRKSAISVVPMRSNTFMIRHYNVIVID
jgi:hypothetical protein